jgi:hypothetical protein
MLLRRPHTPKCKLLPSTKRQYTTKTPALLGPQVIATESYDPCVEAPPVRVKFFKRLPVEQGSIGVRDLVYIPEIFSDEIKKKVLDAHANNKGQDWCGIIREEILSYNSKVIPLHKGCHTGTPYESTPFLEISKWEQFCPILAHVMRTLADGFGMKIVDASRVNFYENSKEWKPFHHDAHAFDDSPRGPTRSTNRNFTALASFGATRQFVLQDTKTKIPTGNLR